MSNSDTLTDDKIYEHAVNIRKVTEERRDEINKYYITLFSAIISILPILSTVSEKFHVSFWHIVNYSLILVSIIGLVLAISWINTLKDIADYLKGIEKFMSDLEQKHHKSFVTTTSRYLKKSEEPATTKITQQEMSVPYTFIVIFVVILICSSIYSINLLLDIIRASH